MTIFTAGLATGGGHTRVDGTFLSRLPKLEIVASYGVGYDHIDAKWAGAHNIVVTNTPDVLNEEVADTALGLILCAVRQLPQGLRDRYAEEWADQRTHLSGWRLVWWALCLRATATRIGRA